MELSVMMIWEEIIVLLVICRVTIYNNGGAVIDGQYVVGSDPRGFT